LPESAGVKRCPEATVAENILSQWHRPSLCRITTQLSNGGGYWSYEPGKPVIHPPSAVFRSPSIPLTWVLHLSSRREGG
jgi:hypothetical protein